MPIVLAAVSTLLFIAVAMVVGVRLLLLAKRSRGLPEFSLGAGRRRKAPKSPETRQGELL